MRTIASGLQSHLSGSNTSLALCWKVTKRNGDIVLGTDHDRDITITVGDFAGTYKSATTNISGSNIRNNSDMSVDNLEVSGAFPETIVIPEITQDDIESGNLNYARVTMLTLNWADPDQGQVVIKYGFMGPLTYDDTGFYKTEIRGIADLLSQNIGMCYTDKCDVKRFGDARCKFDVSTVTITATVTAVTSRREFEVSGITTQPEAYFNGGLLTGLTGANAGFKKQIRIDNSTGPGDLLMFEPFPEDVQVGDTFSMTPGCDRKLQTCRDKYDNLTNFRGFGVFIPGIDKLLQGPVGATPNAP
jgi:uncharacterized phage protein (TIGR02218 family)